MVDGLVGYWKLDEGTGNVTADSSGNGNNGTLINDPTWVDGKYGKALNFSGGSYVSIPDSVSLRVQTFSLEAWVYMTKRPYQQGYLSAIIRRFGQDAEGGYGYMLEFDYANSTDDKLDLSIGVGIGGTIDLQYNSINDLTLNEWHQIIGTFDGHTATLYIDGIPKLSRGSIDRLMTYGVSAPVLLGVHMSD